MIELVLIVAILAVLAAIAIPAYENYIDRINIQKATMDISTIAESINQYETDNYTYPHSLNDVGLAGKLDPWGHPYQYLNIQTATGSAMSKIRKDKSLHPINTYFDLYSMGKDGKTVAPLTAQVSQDDVIWGRDGQFIGLASDF